MPGLDVQVESGPRADEVRAALARMATSEAFRGSPQLVAFLRYVVEATLRGASDRIKGYTIAVEALGRADDFDPQADPIVRVEAMRLRRALNRYYQSGGSRDGVLIDLPLGSYVPAFRRNAAPARPAAATPRRRWQLGLPWRGIGRRRVAASAAFILIGAAIYGALDFWFDFNTSGAHPVFLAGHSPPAAPSGRGPSAYPVIFVGAFRSAGGNGAGAETLRGKLRDALARFDEMEVMTTPPSAEERAGDPEHAPSAGRYRLTASVEAETAGKLAVSIRLTDMDDGRVAYARSFDQVRRDGELVPDEDAIVREVAAALAQPYGIIQAYERLKEFAATGEATQYGCLIEAYDYWRTYDPRQHQRARHCLEQATAAAPGFALGFAALAALVLEEHRGVNRRPDASPALQRALQAARRAVELRPGSARAHQALSEVQFARGDYPLAIELGERAISLNPYDPNILADFGAHLVALGEPERGVRLIRQAAGAVVVRPARQEFFLFLAAYLAGDRAGAARYAAQMTSDTYPLGLLARALVAAQRGESEVARQLLGRLAALCPGWHDDGRGELRKYLAAESIVERIARDLARVSYALSQ